MEQHTVKTYTATIYVGFKEMTSGLEFDSEIVERVCRDYCDKVGFCVTVTPTNFIYTKGVEPGCMVGLINYPRFPATTDKIKEQALTLATILKQAYHQCRVSVVLSDETIMLSGDD